MCGRFTQNYTWEEVYKFLNVFGAPRNLRPHYNIAPTNNVDVIRLDREGRRELVSMRWGLVPYFWKKSLKEVPATFNARAETVAEKPMFRGRRRLANPRLRRALGSLDRSGVERGNPVLHRDRVGRVRLDDAVSRSHACAAAGGGFRRLAERLTWRGRAEAGR